MSIYTNWTNDQLIAEYKRIDKQIHELGRKFDNTEAYEFTTYPDYPDEPFNAKEELGNSIYQGYAAMGAVIEILESRGIEIPT